MFRVLLELVFLVIVASGLTYYVMTKAKKNQLGTKRRKHIPKPGDSDYTAYLEEQLAEEDARLNRLERIKAGESHSQ